MAETKTKPSQTFLSFIIAFAICFNFVGVWAVDAYYESNGITELVFESDSDMQPLVMAYGDNFPVYYDGFDYRSSQTGYNVITSYDQWNKTFVYTGNNHWVTSVNSTGYNYNSVRGLFEIPNLEEFVIDSVNVTTTLNGDADLDFGFGFIHAPASLDYTSTLDGTAIFLTSVDGLTYKSINYTVPLVDAIDIYEHSNKAENINKGFYISVYDASSNGWTEWSWDITVKITAHKLNTWSIMDSVNAIMILGDIILIAVVVLMPDEIDWGGFKKTLKGGRKS